MQEGNRVLIVGGEGDGSNDWLPEMDRYIGQEATIVGFLKSKSGEIVWVDLDIDNKEFAWSPQWLKVLRFGSRALNRLLCHKRRMNQMAELIAFQKNRDDTLTLYDDGKIGVSAYSYEISSYGEFELSKDESRKLYDALKIIFEG